MLEQLKNMERTLHDHRSEMNEMKKERDDYKKRFLSCCDQNKQFQVRESVAYAKIQDAVQMVEAAMREKDAAVQREKEIRGTYTYNVDRPTKSYLKITFFSDFQMSSIA